MSRSLKISNRLGVLTASTLGDIVYLNVFGQGILVLGSQRRAVDLLAKKAVNYSDRPVFAIADL